MPATPDRRAIMPHPGRLIALDVPRGIGITAHLAFMALTTPFILERLVPINRGDDATTSLSDQIAEVDRATNGLTITDGKYWGVVVDRLANPVGGHLFEQQGRRLA